MLRRSCALASAIATVFLVGLPSCGNKDKCQGGERCECYANATCNEGLQCRSNLCVGTSSGIGGSGATSSGIDYEACAACAQKTCKAEYDACKAASGCAEIVECAIGCGSDANCLAGCNTVPSADVGQKIVAYEQCALSDCLDDCVYVPDAGGGTGNAGGASNVGGKSGASGSSSGGKSQGGSAAGGSGGNVGDPPREPTSGTNWLSLDGATAPSVLGVNGKLGIEGVFYAYGDPCATASMSWNPATRCLEGDRCLSGETGENWGVAIGFDFNNVDDTKHAWSATAAGVTGFAWKVTGSLVPSLQFWVQNMDPSFAGTCSAASCSIDGPPDGTSSASASGQLSFASMVKDYWGGTGTSYVFDPSNVSSIQLKIPAATISSNTAYSVCFDQLGVVR
jgi:hypothetical protein